MAIFIPNFQTDPHCCTYIWWPIFRPHDCCARNYSYSPSSMPLLLLVNLTSLWSFSLEPNFEILFFPLSHGCWNPGSLDGLAMSCSASCLDTPKPCEIFRILAGADDELHPDAAVLATRPKSKWFENFETPKKTWLGLSSCFNPRVWMRNDRPFVSLCIHLSSCQVQQFHWWWGCHPSGLRAGNWMRLDKT